MYNIIDNYVNVNFYENKPVICCFSKEGQSISDKITKKFISFRWIKTIDNKLKLDNISKIKPKQIKLVDFYSKYKNEILFEKALEKYFELGLPAARSFFVNMSYFNYHKNKIQKAANNINLEIEFYENVLIAHYPKLTLTNDFGVQHTIFDLYVSFNLKCNKNVLFITPKEGIRTTLRKCEIDNGFYHPHLYNYSSDFCFGSYKIVKEFTENTVEEIEDFFLNIQTFLEFEDLDNPYSTSAQIYDKAEKIKIDSKIVKKIVDKIKKENLNIAYTSKGSFNTFSLIIKEDFENLKKLIPEFLLFIKDRNGFLRKKIYSKEMFKPYYIEKKLPFRQINEKYYFNNKHVRFKIIPNIDILERDDFFISQELRTQINKSIQPKLNEQLNKEFNKIKNSSIRKISNPNPYTGTFIYNKPIS